MKELQVVCGIYYIKNKINGKFYIGSSKDITRRWNQHIHELKKNKHKNSHLQSSFNKYGIESFTFEVLEECPLNNLKEYELLHILKYDFSNLYNLTKNTYVKGSDSLKDPVFLLDLNGNIIEKYSCGADIARLLGRNFIDYKYINTQRIIELKYRIVFPEFYENNIEEIKSWNTYSNKSQYEKEIRDNTTYNFEVLKDGKIHNITKISELISFLGTKHQYINYILRSEQFINTGIFESTRRGGYIIKNII